MRLLNRKIKFLAHVVFCLERISDLSGNQDLCQKSDAKIGPFYRTGRKRVPRGILVGDRQLWNEREMDFDVGDNGREEVL